jgi:hypothetical protein
MNFFDRKILCNENIYFLGAGDCLIRVMSRGESGFTLARQACKLGFDELKLDRYRSEIGGVAAPSTWHLQIDGKRDGLSDARRYA